MTFINERISDEDRKKYDPEGKYLSTLGWTVDRKNEFFLVNIRSGGKEYIEEYNLEWDVLYWKGYFIEYIKKKYRNDIVGHDIIDIENLKIPDEIKDRKLEICEVIHTALLVNKGVGIYGADDITNYKLDLRFVEEK